MTDGREYLPIGTIVELDRGNTYKIAGEPIGYGGGSILYPVQRQFIQNGVVHTDGIYYALKECYPVSLGHFFSRNHIGEIIPSNDSTEDILYLQRAQLHQLEEGAISQTIYQTASRMLPIREVSQSVSLIMPGKTKEVVANTVTIMDSLAEKGRSLTSWIKERRRFAPAEAFRIIQQLLFALREIHQAGHLHLDIQDGNVFLRGTLEDKDELITLIDFGCARATVDGKTAPICDKVIFSTQGFSAPEILLYNDGSLQLGPEADIYSVGCLTLYLLTGQRANVKELIANRTGVYLRSNQLRRLKCPTHLVDTLQQILAKALAKDPKNRYHSADDMLDDVTDLVEALQPYRTDLSSVKYDAFICYKHGSVDGVAALTLQKELENYRAPKGVSTKRKPFGRVFVDEGELSSCADFGKQIREALKNSGWLIVICSPDTPNSPWVQLEIDTFLEHHDRSRILAVLTDGDAETSFPPQLKGNTDGDGEVYAPHALSKTPQEVVKKLRGDTLLKIAAPMLGTTFDTLKQRHKIYQLQRITAVTASFLLAATGFAAYAVNRANVIAEQAVRIEEEYENALLNESRFLAEQAQKRLDDNDPLGAIELALQALPSAEQNRPVLTEAEYVLGKALGIYTTPDSKFDTVTATGKIETSRKNFLLDDSGNYLFTWDDNTGIQVWKTNTMTLIQELYPSENEYSIGCEPIATYGTTMLVEQYHQIISVDFLTGKENWSIEENNLVSAQMSEDHQSVLVFSRKSNSPYEDSYFEEKTDTKNQDPNILHLDILSASSGQILRQIDLPIEGTRYVDSDICVSPDLKYVAIPTENKNTDIGLYVHNSLYLADLESGNCEIILAAETEIYAMQFFDDQLAIIHGKGVLADIGNEFIMGRYATSCTEYLEIFDVATRKQMWSYKRTIHPEYGVSEIEKLAYTIGEVTRTGLLYSNGDWCVLVDWESGKVVKEYTLPSGVMNILYTNNGFETANLDGSYSKVLFDSLEYENLMSSRQYWNRAITAVARNEDIFYVQHRADFSDDYSIYKYQLNKYDTNYEVLWADDKSHGKIYYCDASDGIRAILADNNLIHVIYANGTVLTHNIPETLATDIYYRSIGLSEDGNRLYFSIRGSYDDSSLWINGCEFYVVDLNSGEVSKIPIPEKPNEYSHVGSDYVFDDDTLFFTDCAGVITDEGWSDQVSVFAWNLQNSTLTKLYETCIAWKNEKCEKRYGYNSLKVDMKSGQLFFSFDEDNWFETIPLELVCVDIHSQKANVIPLDFLQDQDVSEFSWYDNLYFWSSDGMTVFFQCGNTIYAVAKNGEVQFVLPLPENTTDLCLSSDESRILAVSNDSVITCYRTADGTLLGTIDLSKYDSRFSDLTEINQVQIDESATLILSSYYGYLLDISGEDIKLKAAIYQGIGYDAKQKRFVVGAHSNTKELGSFPYYSLEDLIQKGNAVLGNNSQS